jgi:hypothetical protein
MGTDSRPFFGYEYMYFFIQTGYEYYPDKNSSDMRQSISGKYSELVGGYGYAAVGYLIPFPD